MAENIAAVLHGPCDLRIEKWPMPEINDNEVLIKIDCCGICGSDLKMYSAGRCGADRLTEPIVLGHEGAGFVIKVGSKVSSLAVGDRVAIEPTQPCRACEFCRQGRYNLCPEPHYCSTVGAPGNLCHYYKHVADFCHKMPDNLSMEEGAAVQPLAIAIHACGRAGIKIGTTLLVLGAGPIGVLCAMTARAMGATKILITDVVESRLETAKKLGADLTLLIREEYSDQQVVDKIRQMLGTSPNVTMDACGFAAAQRVAMMVSPSPSGRIKRGHRPEVVHNSSLPAGAGQRGHGVRENRRAHENYHTHVCVTKIRLVGELRLRTIERIMHKF
ncbi:sorbitol dehydrogenase-like isoform X2 [Maniola hyperantus]|uniref:sorbitol dehydrogenase-like isoform X2 n=1 Tax=Aphantopus hyperantus TaxID=2795564 RepID=UPI00374A0E4E